MLRIIMALFFLGFSLNVTAQKKDSVFVKHGNNGWMIQHTVKAGETIFSLARNYHVPPAMLADANNINYQQQLLPNTEISIPTGAYNFTVTRQTETRPVYYKTTAGDNLHRIARNSNTTQKQIQELNNLYQNEFNLGQILLVGFVLFDATDMNNVRATSPTRPAITVPDKTSKDVVREIPKNDTIYITKYDTVGNAYAKDTVSEGEELYLEQTNNETIVTEEKGTAAFFKRAGRSSNGIYFAFHNTAKRGTILKIFNPGSDKAIYAKVIGKVPTTAAFHNAILGISSDAKIALEARGEKVWCEVTYAP